MNSRTLYLFVFPLIWGVCFLLLAGAAISARPVLPASISEDELRNLAIAWDMWRGGSFLIPHVNGAPAAGELPLMPWLINAGWGLFGLSEIWPRLIPLVFGFSSVFACAALARILWPGWSGIGALSGTVLMGTVLWAVLSTLPGSTLIAVFCLLLAFWGVMYVWRTGLWAGSVIAGGALGAGMLAVGPVILTYSLPVMVSAPLWGRVMTGWSPDDAGEIVPDGLQNWYLQMLAAVGLAVLVGLAWMVPAVLYSEPAYTDALLRQVFVPELRMPDQNAWLYLFLLAGLFLPWMLWPPAWRALGGVRYLVKDGGAWFCVFWILPVLGVFVLRPDAVVSMLLYAMPAFALIMGFLLFVRAEPEAARLQNLATQEPPENHSPGLFSGLFSRGESLVGLVVAVLGALMIVVPLASRVFDLPWWVAELAGGWGVVVLALGGCIAIAMPRSLGLRALVLAVSCGIIVATGFLAAKPLRGQQASLLDAASHISALQSQNIPVAFVGPYQGEFAFTGRLEQPLDVLDPQDPVGAVAWAAGNPGSEIITIHAMLPANIAPVAVFPWWGRYIVFWSVEAIQTRPDIILSENQS